MTRLEKYPWYEEYEDAIDNIIKNKTMTIDKDNILIKGEEKSQFIPFLINRKYKGVDLTTQAIRIHFVNANDNGDYCEPINVEYDETSIRFCWLVPKSACVVQGDLQVSIEIFGENSKDEDYVWKSYTYPMSVEKALDVGQGIVVPDENWYAAFTRQVDALSKRIDAITEKDVDYGAEIRDARVDDQAVVHATMNARFTSDLERMYAKKNYELLEMNKGGYYKVWFGTQEEYDALEDSEIKDDIEYHIIDGKETICGMNADDIFETDDEGFLTPKIKNASHSDNSTQAIKSTRLNNLCDIELGNNKCAISKTGLYLVDFTWDLFTSNVLLSITDLAKDCRIEVRREVETNGNVKLYFVYYSPITKSISGQLCTISSCKLIAEY